MFQQIKAIAARHDAKLEKQLAEDWQTNQARPSTRTEKAGTDSAQVSYLLLRQSGIELPKDLQKARALFRQSVALQVLPDHCFFLMSQRRHATDSTDALFGDALAALAQRPLSEANEILVLSSYLFSPDESISYLAISGYNAANLAGNASTPPKNPALAKAYLGLLLTKSDSAGGIPPAVVYFALKNLVPQYQAWAPELLDNLYAKLAGLAPTVSKDDSGAAESASADLNATSDERVAGWEKRLQKADQISDEGRRDLEYYTILVGYLLPKKDFAMASQVANRISNQELKSKLEDFLGLAGLQAALEKATSDSIASAAGGNKIKDTLLKVIALSSVAACWIKQRATGEALPVLGQAKDEAKHISDPQDRLQANLLLAELTMTIELRAGIDSAAATFKEINKFADFNPRKGTFALKVTVFGLTSDLLITSPLSSSLIATVSRMNHLDYPETFQACQLLTDRKLRTWTTFEAVRTALNEIEKEPKAQTQTAQ